MTRTRSLAAAAVLAVTAALSAGTASAASLPEGTTAILSGDSSLFAPLPAPVASSETKDSTVSQDGRFVAFQSQSDGLFDGDDDRVSNVYVKDRLTGAVILASRAAGPAGEPSHTSCYSPSISDNGSRVAFTCEGPLDPADTNAPSNDVYVRDRTTGDTFLVSRAGNLGAVGNRPSTDPALSETGEYVAFASEASNLDPGATSPGNRVYRRQIGGGNPTILVSRRSQANGGGAVGGRQPSITDDGNRIAFASEPNEAVDPADDNTFADVYVRDVTTQTTVLASRADGAGKVGNGYSLSPGIAGNGSAVVFESAANQFANAEDPDAALDIYRRSLTTGTTALVSVNAGGQKGTSSFRPAVDDSGDVVAFSSSSTALHPDDGSPGRDAYVKNVITNEIQVASREDGAGGKVANAGSSAVAVSGDGTKIAIGLDSGSIPAGLDPRHGAVVLRDLTGHHTEAVSRPPGSEPFASTGGHAYGGALSADGRYAAFVSAAPALGLTEDVRSAVFVRDRVTGAVTLASRADGASGAPLPVSDDLPSISADGRRVAFSVGNGPDRGVWVRDLAAGATFLASRADGPGGEPANDNSSYPALDADGSRVVFASNATNLGDGDADNLLDVHVRDLASGRTILASRAVGGEKGTGESGIADISADGTRVAFVSYADNLGDGDPDTQADVHLRDLAAETTTLVSATPDGTKANGGSYQVSMDASGTRVAFASAATNLPGGGASQSEVYVRDLAGGTLELASRADGPDGAPAAGETGAPVISPDGGYVAFGTSATNLSPGIPERVAESYVRDLRAGRTELVSRASGPDGRPAARGVAAPTGLSAGAGCVSFSSEDALVGAQSDYAQVYLRARLADCGSPADARDTTAPVISGARLSRRRFRVGRARTPLAAKIRRGTVLRFRSTEAGTATIAFARKVRARNGHVRFSRAGRLTRTIREGGSRVALSGRVGRRAMRAGRYRMTLQVRDAAGNRSRPVRLRFRVAR